MPLFLINFIKSKVLTIMFKKFKERVKRRAMETFKGKLTYGSLAAMLLPLLSQAIGFEVLPADVEPVYNGILAVLAVWGKYRASRGYA